MKRIFKILLVIAGGLVILGSAFSFYGEKWFNENLEDALNGNPDRLYDFRLGEVEFKFFGNSINLIDLEILPRAGDSTTQVKGKIQEAFLRNVHLIKLLTKRQLLIDNMEFLNPEIEVQLFENSQKRERPGDALQEFFGQILSKGGIKNFRLKGGNAVFYENGIKTGALYNLGIDAEEMETDSIKVQYPIPFDYKKIAFSFDSVSYEMNENQLAKLGCMTYDSEKQLFTLNHASLQYKEGSRKFARSQEHQKDIVEFTLDSLALSGFGHEIRLHADLDIRAKKLELFGLDLTDYRDKAKPRPAEDKKPMFQGLMSQVNFPLSLDTLKITDSSISYSESVPLKGEYWTIHFDQMNGVVTNLTTIPEYQRRVEHFDLEVKTSLQGYGLLNAKIEVPYDRDEFKMEADFRNYSLPHLNQILKPIMNGRLVSGELDRMMLRIHAEEKSARVAMVFDYHDLKVELYTKEGQKKNMLASTLANWVINTRNSPGDKNYLTPNYTVLRNQRRGPFNLIWQSTKEGIFQVIPGGAAKELLKGSDN